VYFKIFSFICLVVGRPEFDSLTKSNQKTLKVDIHSFPAWHSAFTRFSVKIGWQVRLLCLWARHLMELPSYLWEVRLVVTGGSLNQKPKTSHCCLLVKVPWQINKYVNLQNNRILKAKIDYIVIRVERFRFFFQIS